MLCKLNNINYHEIQNLSQKQSTIQKEAENWKTQTIFLKRFNILVLGWNFAVFSRRAKYINKKSSGPLKNLLHTPSLTSGKISIFSGCWESILFLWGSTPRPFSKSTRGNITARSSSPPPCSIVFKLSSRVKQFFNRPGVACICPNIDKANVNVIFLYFVSKTLKTLYLQKKFFSSFKILIKK